MPSPHGQAIDNECACACVCACAMCNCSGNFQVCHADSQRAYRRFDAWLSLAALAHAAHSVRLTDSNSCYGSLTAAAAFRMVGPHNCTIEQLLSARTHNLETHVETRCRCRCGHCCRADDARNELSELVVEAVPSSLQGTQQLWLTVREARLCKMRHPSAAFITPVPVPFSPSLGPTHHPLAPFFLLVRRHVRRRRLREWPCHSWCSCT